MDCFNRRVTINIRGLRFQTMEQTLAKFPDTLLGNVAKRQQFYDPVHSEYYFDRDKFAFDAILFYYQSRGHILCRPETVPREIFDEELEFYQIYNPRRSEEEKPRELPQKEWKKKLWLLLEDPKSSKQACWLAQVSMLVIILSVIVFCLETLFIVSNDVTTNLTLHQSQSTMSPAAVRLEVWFIFDTSFVVWFTAEYVTRLVSAPRKSSFVLSTLGIIDLVAILPYFVSLGTEASYARFISFTGFRVFRLLRVIRLLKLTRYVAVLRILGYTIRSCQDQLIALMSLVLIAVILFSACIFFVENKTNPEQFPSIPAAFWWSIITMTTVGYGYVCPISPLGKLVGAVCAIFGVVVLLCLPTPVFISHFTVFYCKHKSAMLLARKKAIQSKPGTEKFVDTFSGLHGVETEV